MPEQALSRSYGRFFAEFLNGNSLVPLGLLALSTCVGFRYGDRTSTFTVLFSEGSSMESARQKPNLPAAHAKRLAAQRSCHGCQTSKALHPLSFAHGYGRTDGTEY